MSVLYLILILVLHNAHSEKCPSGNCIPLNQCPSLYSLVTQLPISLANTKILRNSVCGYVTNYPKVCCPLENARQELLPLDGCGISTNSRIFGGSQTDLDEFPWMSLLFYQTSDGARRPLCGGVLISKRFVLTAAHCVYKTVLTRQTGQARLVSVRLGEHNTSTNPDCRKSFDEEECAHAHVDVPIQKIIVHGDYNASSQNNDISLIKLSQDVEFTDFVKPVCLPLSRDARENDYVGRKLFVAGWGTTETLRSSHVKLKVQVPVVELSVCNGTYFSKGRRHISKFQICAGGEQGKDSCQGDSGGPLMATGMNENGETRWYAAGIVSFGPKPCGTKGVPGVYTRVGKYVDWITQNIEAEM